MTNFTGTPGNDSLIGTGNADTFDLTQGGNDTAIGGGSADTFVFGSTVNSGDYVEGNQFNGSTISIDGDYSSGVEIHANYFSGITFGSNHSYNLRFIPGVTANSFGLSAATLSSGNYLLFDGSSLSGPSVTLVGSPGNDTIIGIDSPYQFIFGGAGDDYLRGPGTLTGESGNDTLVCINGRAEGGDGNDLLIGTGYSPLSGQAGDDTLVVTGVAAHGDLSGGDGQDRYVFQSLPAGLDIQIDDFQEGELIDLSAVSNLAFIGTHSFSGVAGQFRYDRSQPHRTYILFDTDGDGATDRYTVLFGELTLKETSPGSKLLELAPDVTPPKLVSALPTDNSTNVGNGSNIVLIFDEDVQFGTGDFELHTADGTLVRSIPTSAAQSWGSHGVLFSMGPTTPGTSYYVTVSPDAVQDMAGHPYMGFSSSNTLNFTTATQNVPPAVTVSTSETNAYPVDKDIVFTYTNLIVPSYSGSGSILVYHSSATLEVIPITDASRVTIVGNTLIINPSLDLPLDSNPTLAISVSNNSLENLAGFPAGFGIFPPFTTASAANTPHPLLVSTSPSDDTLNVAVNSAITLTFDQPVYYGAGLFEFRRADGALVQAIGVADFSQVSYSGNSITVQPTVPLAPGVTYSVTLVPGAIRDLAGNSFLGITSPTAFDFTSAGTADTTAPTIAASSPADDAGNVSLGSDITLTFSEPVQRGGSGSIDIHNADNSLFKSIPITDPFQVQVAGNRVMVDPNVDLDMASDYYVTITTGAFKDNAGNSFAGISSATALNFTTLTPPDTEPPLLRSSFPADDQINVLPSSNITLSFSEAVAAGTGNFVIRNTSDGSATQTIPIIDAAQVTIDDRVVTINPAHDLDFGKSYYVTLDSGVIVDLAGNSYAGISSPMAFNFTTKPPPDFIPPTLISVTPADNSTGLPTDLHFSFTFSEPVKAGIGDFVIHRSSDDSVVYSFAVQGSGRVAVSGNTVTFDPYTLSTGTGYYVTIAPGVITDFAGNSFAGISGKFDLNFVTVPFREFDPPHLVWSSPVDDASAVPVDANILLTFGEAVKPGTGQIILHNGSDNSQTAIDIADTSQIQVHGNLVTVNPAADLSPNTLYYVTMGPGVILDQSNNEFAGISARTDLNFVTTNGAGSGLTFNIFYNESVGVPAELPTALETATKFFTDHFTDPITINLHVGWGEVRSIPLDSHAIAASIHDAQSYSYDQIVKAFAGDVTSVEDSSALQNIPNTDPANAGSYSVSVVEAAALRLPGASITVDAHIGFSNTLPFDFDRSDGVTGGKFDFFAAAIHEISETMGRVLGVGQPGYRPFDLFRFSDTGIRDFTGTQPGYFSILNGLDRGPNFNSDSVGDFGDWAGNGDAFSAFGTPGNVASTSPADLLVMDVLGYDKAPVPNTFPLTLLATSPWDEQFEVGLGANIDLLFSKGVKAGSGSVVIHRMSDGSAAATIPIDDASQIHFLGSVVTIDPTANLSGRTGYYLTVSSGAITDWDGQAYGGISSSTVLNFTTADPPVPAPLVIETNGATTLASSGNHFYLLQSGNGPSLKVSGQDVVIGQFGGWTPIGAEATASGYEIAWKSFGSNLYSLWNTDTNGNYIANVIGAVSGSDPAILSAESLFQQDLNGDGQLGSPMASIETNGATTLALSANHFYLLHNGSGPSLKSSGQDVAAGQFGDWTPIAAEATASGYEVAWKSLGSNLYSLWNTDANGNYVANIVGAVSGTDTSIVLSENLFQQDLNGDGKLGSTGATMAPIETHGTTTLASSGSHFYLLQNGNGPSLKSSGQDVAAGQFGDWTPIGAEQTQSGYEVAWKSLGSGLYSLWNTDANGNYIANIVGGVSGSDPTFLSAESFFQQDLNGDGQVASAMAPIESNGTTTLALSANHFYLLQNGNGPSLKSSGQDIVSGQFGDWTPIGAEQTQSGYEIAWKSLGSNLYSLWNTDANGNYIANIVGGVSGSDPTFLSAESFFQQDLNGDGHVASAMAAIESNGATTLALSANHFYLLQNGNGPSLKSSGQDVVSGQFGDWTPIAAEQTGSGYEIAWKSLGSNLYSLWNTDANGNYLANIIGAVSGSDPTFLSAESFFQQDLNGDGHWP